MEQLRIKEEGPVVLSGSFVDKSYLYYLADMMKISDSKDVNNALSQIFLRLGYTDKDTIRFKSVPKDAWDMVRIIFEVNGKENIDVKFHRRYGKDVLGLSLTDSKGDNYGYQCRVSENDGEFSADVYLKGYHVGKDKNLVICERGFDGVNYVFFSADDVTQGKLKQQLTLNVECSVEEAFENRDNGVYYSPRNEAQLIEYLRNISYPVDLCSVYNGICDISFDDVSSLVEFNLNVVTENKTKGFNDREVTDQILFKRGKLERFGLLHEGKVGDCIMDNRGFSVIFIGNGYIEYKTVAANGGFTSSEVDYVDCERSAISTSCVRKVAEKLIDMFPERCDKMFKGRYQRDDDLSCEQISMFDQEKVYKKKD